jgi:hypothetical protein
MHIVNWRRILLILVLFAPASLFAATCATTIHTIHADLTEHTNSIDHHYRWANLHWLEKNFGTPSTRVSSKGAIYFWRCDGSNFLSVDSDTANKTMLVSGQYSDDSGAGVFSVEVNSGFVGVHSNSYREVMAASHTPMPPSALNPITAPVPVPVAAVPPASMRAAPVSAQPMAPALSATVAARAMAPVPESKMQNLTVQDFKNWFNIDIQSQNQLSDVALQKTQDYYSKLRTCTPGNYTYPIFNADPMLHGKQGTALFFLSNSTIAGMKHGRCVVNTISNLPQHLQHTRCAFTPATLKYFTADNAKLTLEHNMQHSSHLQANMRAIKHECSSDFKAPRAELTTHGDSTSLLNKS